MHEMGVVLNIVRTAEQAAKANHVAKIGRLTLQVGELTGVIPRYVYACWPAAIEDTILNGAILAIEEIEGIATCQDCGCDYSVLKNIKADQPICPACGSKQWKVKTGREVMIKEIGVIDNL